MTIPARRIVAHVLSQNKKKSFTADPGTLHKVFYELYKSNPEAMAEFKFIVRDNPYSPTLDDQFQLLQLTGVISLHNPDYINYKVNRKRLKSLLEIDDVEFDLKNTEVLEEIFI